VKPKSEKYKVWSRDDCRSHDLKTLILEALPKQCH